MGTRFASRHPSVSRFVATGEGSTLMNLFETPHLLWMKLKLREKVVIASSGESFAQPAMKNSKLYGVWEARSSPASLNYTTSQRSPGGMDLTAARGVCLS